MSQQQDEVLFYEGQLTTVTLPSKKRVTIRETNGDDDQHLSSLASIPNGKNIYQFLSGIIKKDEDTGSTLVTPEEIKAWKANDVWFLIFKQRVLNHGDKLVFNFTGPNDGDPTEEYTEDLSVIDVDLSRLSNPGLLSPGDKKKMESIAYPSGSTSEIEFATSRGNKFKFNILSAEEDRKLLDSEDNDKHLNTGLLARKLKVYKDNAWVLVKHFGPYPSKEMAEIRTTISRMDNKFNPMVKFTYQGQFVSLPLFTIKDFFWPETI